MFGKKCPTCKGKLLKLWKKFRKRGTIIHQHKEYFCINCNSKV